MIKTISAVAAAVALAALAVVMLAILIVPILLFNRSQAKEMEGRA